MTSGDLVTVEIQHESLSIDPDLCRRALRHVFRSERVRLQHVTLIQSNHSTVRQLNREFLDHDFDTDVLAFRYSEQDADLEGEIYVDVDTAHERHNEFEASFEEEVLRYAIHGALHLVGYTDDTDVRKAAIRTLEDRYLSETISD